MRERGPRPLTPDGPPDPDETTTPAEYVGALRSLREWSGLTYRQLAAKAATSGDVLPSSTVASALSRNTLPRQQVVMAFVRACGLDGAAAARWVAARDRLAAGPVVSPGDDEEFDPKTKPAVARTRRSVTAAVAVVLAGVAAVVVWSSSKGGDDPPAGPAAPEPLPDGWYLIRPAHVADHGLCLGEGRERNGRTDRPLAVQRPCGAVSPDTYLKSAGPQIVEIQWHHPTHGAGCLTVDDAHTGPGALLAPEDCTGAAHQRYLLDASAPGRYRLRPVHSGLCVGILGGRAEVNVGAEAMQAGCTGDGDQEFLIVATERASRPE
ncbi:RICIN domain-containing protein [Actinoplanes solisilvae]|uniref:RICIN domain-containing protein n=1 Tax=Actinoplanes solisilvae TaxID=2486853 RepID=UPI000FD832B6|nr:RICIN domain-containing protein [Actinoplanes solisilvae]